MTSRPTVLHSTVLHSTAHRAASTCVAAVLASLALFPLALFPLGCGQAIEEVRAADASVASFESSSELSHTSSLYTDSLRDVPIEADTEEAWMAEAHARIYATLGDAFAGCVTPYPEDDDPTTVGAQFNCTGSTGLFQLTGVIEGSLKPRLQGLKVIGAELALVTNDLIVSNRPMEGEILVEYTIATDLADLDLDFTIVDPKAGTLLVGMEGTLNPSTVCLNYDGAISAEGDQLTAEIQVTDFERCKGSCPTDGGQAIAQITDERGDATLTIDFDGTSSANVTSTRGREFEVELTCAK